MLIRLHRGPNPGAVRNMLAPSFALRLRYTPTPPHRSWCSTAGGSRRLGASWPLGLMQRTKCSPVVSSSATSSRSWAPKREITWWRSCVGNNHVIDAGSVRDARLCGERHATELPRGIPLQPWTSITQAMVVRCLDGRPRLPQAKVTHACSPPSAPSCCTFPCPPALRCPAPPAGGRGC